MRLEFSSVIITNRSWQKPMFTRKNSTGWKSNGLRRKKPLARSKKPLRRVSEKRLQVLKSKSEQRPSLQRKSPLSRLQKPSAGKLRDGGLSQSKPRNRTVVTKDGRTIRSGKDYTAFRYELWLAQDKRCVGCGRVTDLLAELEAGHSFHVDHERGRGGGKRDDTFLSCKGLCGKCHRIKHGQQSAVQSQPQWSRR